MIKLIGAVVTTFVVCVWLEVLVVKDTIFKKGFTKNYDPCHELYTFYSRDFRNYW